MLENEGTVGFTEEEAAQETGEQGTQAQEPNTPDIGNEVGALKAMLAEQAKALQDMRAEIMVSRQTGEQFSQMLARLGEQEPEAPESDQQPDPAAALKAEIESLKKELQDLQGFKQQLSTERLQADLTARVDAAMKGVPAQVRALMNPDIAYARLIAGDTRTPEEIIKAEAQEIEKRIKGAGYELRKQSTAPRLQGGEPPKLDLPPGYDKMSEREQLRAMARATMERRIKAAELQAR